MPSAAFLKAAKRGNRRPVVLLAVESPAAYKAAITTASDWQACPVLTNLNISTEPGSVFLKSDGPDPYAASYPDPGEVETFTCSPTTYFNAADWVGQTVGYTRPYLLDVWTPWTLPTSAYAGSVTLNIRPHCFDGLAGSMPIVTGQFTFDIYGSLNGGPATLLLANQTANNAAVVQSYSPPISMQGSWRFQLHITRKISVVSSTANGYAHVPNWVYDNSGPSYLEIKSFTESYGVGLYTSPLPYALPPTMVNGIVYSTPCDSWTDYSPSTNPHATEATLYLHPLYFNTQIALRPGQQQGWLVTISLTFQVWGSLNGGEPHDLTGDLTMTGNGIQTVKVSSLAQGSWTFAIRITGKLNRLDLGTRAYSGPPVAIEPATINFISYTTNQQTNYLPTGFLQTRVLDLGLVPSQPTTFQAEYGPGVSGLSGVPAGAGLSYAAWGSDTNNGSDWTSLGPVLDGQQLAPFQYYYLTASFSASPNGLGTPYLSELRIVAGSYDYFSTMKDVPVKGAKPYIVEGSLNSLSCSIELMACGKIGQISPRLFWTQVTSDMLATGYLKNKKVLCKIGYPELAEKDYEPYFGGTWYDYTADHDQRQITVQTRDVWNQLKNKVPPGDASSGSYWTDANGQKIPGKVYYLEGNIIDVMLQVASVAGVPDRDLDRAGFAAMKAAHFPDSDWYVRRGLTSSQDADKLLGDLQIAAGIFLFPAPTGVLTAVHYDSVVNGEPAATLDALKIQFKPIAGGQKDLYTRQLINYQLLPGKDGGSESDFASQYLKVCETAEIDWQESPAHTKSWNDAWGVGYNPATGKVANGGAIVRLAQRMEDWYANPRMTVQATNIPPRFLGVYPGSLIAVNNLRLPAPAADWPGFVTGKKWLLMQRSINPADLTLSWDLLEVGPTEYLPGNLPSYQVFDRYPAVLNLRANECVVQRASGPVYHLIVLQFDRPTDYIFGSAEVWMRVNGGNWTFFAPAAFSSAVSSWIEVPCIVGYQYDFAVITVNSAGLKQQLALAPQTSITATGVSTIAYLPPGQSSGTGTGSGGDTGLPGVVVTPPSGSGFPPVTGLQLAGQGNDNSFVGRDAKFTWNRYSFSYQLGAADGSAGGPVDSALIGYKITVRNTSGTIRRMLTVASEEYTYTYEQNHLDGNGVATRNFSIEVIALGVAGNSQATSLSVTNPAPQVVTGIQALAFIGAFSIGWQPGTVPDLSGYVLHGVLSGAMVGGDFTPSDNNLLNRGPESSVLISRNNDGSTLVPGDWYVKIAAYDSFGEDLLNWSELIHIQVSPALSDILGKLEGQISTDQLTADLASTLGSLGDEYILKTDSDGNVAGIGLRSTSTSSSVRIYCDQFAVINRDTPVTGIVPFIVDVDYGVIMNNALVKKLTADSIDVSTLVVGDGTGGTIIMGPSARISWGNVTGQPAIPNGTNIDSAGIYTGTIEATQISAGTIIGSTLETAASGKRFVVSTTDNTIKMFTGEGLQPIQIGYTASSHPTTAAGYLMHLDASDPGWLFTTGLLVEVYGGYGINTVAYGAAGVGIVASGGRYGGIFQSGSKGAIQLAPSAAPTSPDEGAIYYDSTSKHFYGWNGTTWKQLDN